MRLAGQAFQQGSGDVGKGVGGEGFEMVGLVGAQQGGREVADRRVGMREQDARKLLHARGLQMRGHDLRDGRGVLGRRRCERLQQYGELGRRRRHGDGGGRQAPVGAGRQTGDASTTINGGIVGRTKF